MQLGRKKFILRVWSLIPEQSEGNNRTSKINLFPVSYTIFFLLGDQKMDLFDPHGAIKSTQVRIAGTENMAQYWTNLGSHKLANVTGPISAFKLAQCCLSTGMVHWKSKFPMLAPKLGPAMALYWAESWHYSGKLCCMYSVAKNSIWYTYGLVILEFV